jgi:putative peptide zinc metalloprotease protein
MASDTQAPARAAAEAAPPRLADGVELIGEFTGSGFEEPPYIARRADGQIVQIGKLFYLVAERIDGEASYDEIAERVTESAQRELDGELAQYIVEEKLRPLGLIATEAGAAQELSKVDPLLALKFRAGVISEHHVNRIATIFRPLFLPPVVAGVLGSLVALDVWLFGFHGIAQSLRETLYRPAFILLTLGLVIVSAAFHECGHATACRYGGARPGKMGVGLYLVWPALYTDVTDAYRLNKGGRLRTDLGGVYFNAIFILLTAAAYFATGFEPLLLIIPLQHAEILHQFLPVVRLDGYYIISDLAGVPDMFRRIGPTLKSLAPWRRAEPAVAELKRWVRLAVAAYVLTLVPLLLFVLAITVINVPRILATSWDSGTLEYRRIERAVDAGSWLAAVVGCIQLVVLVLVPVGLLLTLGELGRKAAARAWKTTDDRPAARATFVLVAASIAAFAAYTWFPSAVYRPIQPGEKGTLVGAFEQLSAIMSGRPALTAGRERDLGGAPFRSKQHRPSAGDTGPGAPAQTPVRPATPGTTNPPARGAPSLTVSTPVATATTPSAKLTTPTLSVPSPSVITPTLPAPTPTVTVTTPSLSTPTLPLPTTTSVPSVPTPTIPAP